jgi:RNA polymerase sigma-70 factor (ECF subfamily)
VGPITLTGVFTASDVDLRLAEAAVAGQDDAFTALFEAHHQEVYRTALAVLGRHEAALDAVQETFFKVHQCLGSWRGEASLRTWIVRIAVRCAIDLRRRSVADPGANTPAPEPWHDPRAEIDRSIRVAQVRKLADGLAGQSGLILRLRLFAGQSNQEIASSLSLSEANVRVQLSNAVRRLREML